MELQPRLLRALESREVVPVGANEAQAFDVRLISASNKDLHAEVGAGRFREDLLYRLNTVVIPIPPLRERGNDALIIAEHVLAGLRKRLGRPSLRLGDSAKRRVLEYPWPGNVRELRHAVERAAILSELDEIGPDALGLGDGRQAAPPTGSDYVPRDAELASGDGGKLPTLNLTELERRAVRTAMEQCHGNVSRAAELLGISRAALYRRLAREGDE
jgi:DNA-binding NtrC family response regulator